MKKQTKKATQTKANLCTAFWELYKEKPISKIAVKDVTDRAGYYRSTFYLYYTDVYQILGEIEDNILQDWKSTSATIWEQGLNEHMFEKVAEFYGRNGEHMSVLLSPQGDPVFMCKIKEAIRPQIFSRFNFPEGDIKGELMFEMGISAMLAYLTVWYRNAERISPKEAAVLYQSLVFENAIEVMIRHADK